MQTPRVFTSCQAKRKPWWRPKLDCNGKRSGDFIHIPGEAKHAWRNVSGEPMAALITCTAKLGRALREMGQLANEAGKRIPRPADIQRLMEISKRYGYWLGNREENAAVGIELA